MDFWQALVWDVERGSPNSIYEEPWQTCSCLGGWHYDTRLAENGWYKSASDVVKLLVDVVSIHDFVTSILVVCRG